MGFNAFNLDGGPAIGGLFQVVDLCDPVFLDEFLNQSVALPDAEGGVRVIRKGEAPTKTLDHLRTLKKKKKEKEKL